MKKQQKSNIKYTAKDTIWLGKISTDRKFLQMQNNLYIAITTTPFPSFLAFINSY
jgi:hypothetical protein